MLVAIGSEATKLNFRGDVQMIREDNWLLVDAIKPVLKRQKSLIDYSWRHNLGQRTGIFA